MSQSESPANLCPRCRAELPADALRAVCPRCALGEALASSSEERETQFLSLHDIPAPGQKVPYIGDYEPLEVIARGGMGVVYKARQCTLNRTVALKMLLGGAHAGDDFKHRFRREAETAAKLQHPNIVPIYEVGEHDGQPYFAMEYVAGETLAQKVQDHPLPADEAASYVRAVAEAVHYAHGQGVLHRDLKPSNILVGVDDRPRVTDFGLARQEESASDLTMSGQALGTPGYLPPEQASGRRGDVGPASDVYGLGAVLYHLLTGRPPFVTNSVAETLEQVRHAEPASPRQLNPAVPKDLQTICLKCLEKETARRYGSAKELSAELGRFRAGEPILARPPGSVGRAWKWAQRRPVPALLSLALALAVLGGCVGVTFQWRKAQAAAVGLKRAYAAMDEALARADMQISEGLFQKGDDAYAVAFLGRLLRQHPRNDAAASRLAAALAEPAIAGPLREYGGFANLAIAAAFSRDGKRIVVASGDSTARMFDVGSGVTLATFTNHTDTLWGVDFSPDGTRVVTASSDGTARIWSASTGAQIASPLQHTNAARTGSAQWVTCARFSPDGRTVYTASEDGTARVWDALTAKPISEWLVHDAALRSGGFSSDGSRVLTACWAGYAQVWDWQSGKPLNGRLQHGPGGAAVKWAEFSPDGRLVASACDDHTVRIWDVESGMQTHPSFLHEDMAVVVCFSPENGRVAVGTEDGAVAIWEIQSARRISGAMRHAGRINHVEFSGDGLLLATAGDDHTARLWDGHTGSPLATFRHSTTVKQARLSPEGRYLLSVSGEEATGEGLARLWDIGLFFPRSVDLHHGRPVGHAAFGQGGDQLATGSGGGTVSVWSLLDGSALRAPLSVTDGTEPVSSLLFSRDCRELLGLSASGRLSIWRSDQAEPRLRILYPDWICSASYSPDGTRLVTGSRDGVAGIYSTANGVLLVTNLEPHPGWVLGAKFSPDGSRFVTFSTDGSARVWDANNGRPVTNPLRHNTAVNVATFDPRGKLVASGSADATSRIWDAATGELLSTMHHAGPVVCVSFDGRAERLATASWDHAARIWDVATGRLRTPPFQHRDRVTAVHFSPDDRWVVTASADHTARVWEASTGLPVTALLQHAGTVNEAQFSPDGQRLVTISDDSTARVWELPPRAGIGAEFLTQLADATTALRLEEDDSIRAIPFSKVQLLRSNLLSAPDSEARRRFAGWVLAERARRTVTPTSALAIPEFVRRLLTQDGRGSAELAVRMEPTNPLALSRLAAATATDTKNPLRAGEAAMYLGRAVGFGLDVGEADRVRAILAELAGTPP